MKLRVIAAATLVMLIALITAEFVVAHQVRSRITEALSCAADGAATPEVSLGHTPVLLELATGGLGPVTLTFDYDSVAERIGAQVQALSGATLGEQDGLLTITLQEQMLGRPLKVLLDLTTDGSSLVLTPQSLVIGDRQVQAALLQRLTGEQDALEPRTFDPELPEGVSLEKVSATSDGLAVTVAIDKVTGHGQCSRDGERTPGLG
ncbi:hypothetical protein [Kineosporia babensis]|uniref:DUF2993 domain-containing protein n=1 Tax=Kineosporia babensis TaxID=499548 RepID=A0A9X1SXG5_9ACTN|nr:hypothetical protein [Kineosporia babensis]MCD5315160.1 hypothetical protein [Kineosporia babensis]